MVQQEWESGEQSDEGLREGAPRSHQAHEAIVEAIVGGDAALAQHRMRRHLQAIAALLDDEAADEQGVNRCDSAAATVVAQARLGQSRRLPGVA
ncbi:FCD domain-containing protein [Yinghuangia aomiensis]